MNEQDWTDLASVFRAGSVRAAGWGSNTAMQQHAEILEAQAVQCETIAWNRAQEAGPPYPQPLSHEHVHDHGFARHMHRHAHPFDSLDHAHDHEPGHEPRAVR